MSSIFSVAIKFRHSLVGAVNSLVEGTTTSLESVRNHLLRATTTDFPPSSHRHPKGHHHPLSPSDYPTTTTSSPPPHEPLPPSFYLLRSEYKPTRNPIVLCHGLYGFDKIGYESFPNFQVHYWLGVADALRKLGIEVVVAKVAKTGSIAYRARQLHEIIESTLPNRQVNLIGHSMGGLDGRYLITHIPNKSYQVASLTTVSTPHHGSPFMDWCQDQLKVGKILDESLPDPYSESQDWINKFSRYLDAPAYSNLTTHYMKNTFNPATPDDVSVGYFSYNAYLDNMHLFSSLHFPWSIINRREGRNDGLVTLESGRWGELVETVQANHFDLVTRFRLLSSLGGWLGLQDARYMPEPSLALPKALMYGPESNFDNVEFYLRMVTFLHSRGY